MVKRAVLSMLAGIVLSASAASARNVRVHRVQSGDTLWEIASEWATSRYWRDDDAGDSRTVSHANYLAVLNGYSMLGKEAGGRNPNRLQVGDPIMIPDNSTFVPPYELCFLSHAGADRELPSGHVFSYMEGEVRVQDGDRTIQKIRMPSSAANVGVIYAGGRVDIYFSDKGASLCGTERFSIGPDRRLHPVN